MATVLYDGSDGMYLVEGTLADVGFPGLNQPAEVGPSHIPASIEGGMVGAIGRSRSLADYGPSQSLFSGTVDPALVGGSVVGRDVWLCFRSTGVRIAKAVTDANGDFSFQEYFPSDLDDYEFQVVGDDYVTQHFPVQPPAEHRWNPHPHLASTLIP
jgi:hypothetical protein